MLTKQITRIQTLVTGAIITLLCQQILKTIFLRTLGQIYRRICILMLGLRNLNLLFLIEIASCVKIILFFLQSGKNFNWSCCVAWLYVLYTYHFSSWVCANFRGKRFAVNFTVYFSFAVCAQLVYKRHHAWIVVHFYNLLKWVTLIFTTCKLKTLFDIELIYCGLCKFTAKT